MALPTTHNVGTASINANEVTVTGQGTTWLTSGLEAGDLFWAGGLSVRIAAVNSNTSITLAYPWPGATRIAAAYEVQFVPDTTRALASARAVLDAIAGGNLKSIGDLVSAADKIAYFTGAGTAALADFKSIARGFLADNFQPVQQGGGAGQGSNKIRVGYSGTALKAQVDDTDLGKVWTDSIAVTGPGWIRLPNGLLFQYGSPVALENAFGTGVVTLPTPFANNTYGLIIGNGDAAINYHFANYVGGGYPSNAQFAFQSFKPDGSGGVAGNVRISFLAIGFAP